MAAERVAFVAYHKDQGPRPTPPPGAERHKIHLVGHPQMVVLAALSAQAEGLGFKAIAVDPDSPFHEIFFYHHGVLAKEKDEPIGELLVKEGAVGKEDLARGVGRQNSERAIPIGQILVEQRKIAPDDAARAAKEQQRRKLRIGEVLVEAGLIKASDVDAALAEQKRRKGKRLGETLVELGLLDEKTLARTLAVKFQLPFVDLDRVAINPAALQELPLELIEKYCVLPIEVDAKLLTVAICNPLALDALDVVRFQSKRVVEDVLVTPSQLKRHVAEHVNRLKHNREAPSEFGSS